MFIEYNNKQKINKKWIHDKNKNKYKYMTIYYKSDRILRISRIMSKTKFKIFITSPPCLEHPNTQWPFLCFLEDKMVSLVPIDSN